MTHLYLYLSVIYENMLLFHYKLLIKYGYFLGLIKTKGWLCPDFVQPKRFKNVNIWCAQSFLSTQAT